jgi:hypothetical protein
LSPPELVRLDGKTIRGAKDAKGNRRHLLAALAGPTAQDSVLAAQAEVGAKTNEVPMATGVLGQIDLTGKIVTADALHTVKGTADFICDNGGEFGLPVKENRQALFSALDALPWRQVHFSASPNDLETAMARLLAEHDPLHEHVRVRQRRLLSCGLNEA